MAKTRKDNKSGSTRKLQNGKWECVMQSKYINPDSKSFAPKRIKKTGDTEKEAIKKCKQALMIFEKQVEQQEISKIDPKKTFGEYMREYLDREVKNRVTGSTYKSYCYTMEANFFNYSIAKLPLSSINTVAFEKFFDTVTHDKSAKTAAFPIQLCKQLSKELYGKSLLAEDYAVFAKTKRQKRDEYFEENKEQKKECFSYDDIRKFYDSYKNGVSEYSALIIFMFETMLRGQEALALTLDCIDFTNDKIVIKKAVSERFVDGDRTKGLEKYVKVPKNGKERIVYMTPLAKECALYMINQTNLKCRENPNKLLLPSFCRAGKMRSMDAFEMQFKALCNKLGINRDVHPVKMPSGKVINKGLSVHAIRHTAITIANTAPGANVINTALQAGHNAIRTENIYTHANMEGLKHIATASSAVLNLTQEKDTKSDISEEDRELYELYKKLKEKFENI